MKLSRFFVENKIVGDSFFIDEAELVHQFVNVLKFKIGERVVVFDGSGVDFVCEILEIGKKGARLAVVESRENNSEPRLNVVLFQSLIKRDNFENAIAKSVETGATEFVPVLADRSEKKDFNRARLEKIIKESVEQSGRAKIPKIADIVNFDKAIQAVDGLVFLLDASGEPVSKYFNKIKNSDKVSLFVGPEGGWTEQEIEMARERGAKIISLGRRVLRSETAGHVSIGVLLACRDEE